MESVGRGKGMGMSRMSVVTIVAVVEIGIAPCGWHSQTCKPGHHDFSGHSLFELWRLSKS